MTISQPINPSDVALLKQDDVLAIERSQFWLKQRLDVMQISGGAVIVKALREQRHPFRYGLLNFVAWVLKMPMLKAAPAPGGAAAQSIEVERLRQLRQAGVRVPAVLHAAADWFALEYIDAPSLLESLMLEKPSDAKLSMWVQGAKAIGHVHVRGQALSQAFARNILWHHGETWFIDFEDDPITVMPLQHAQVRDWLAYLHSTIWLLRQQDCSWLEIQLAYQRISALIHESVKQLLDQTMQRASWLRHLPIKRQTWGRDVVMLQALGEFFYLTQKQATLSH